MNRERRMLARVRSRVRRQITEAEDDAFTGGEINLVPYLDIVTNIVIFFLATIASVVALANLNVAAPRYADPAALAAEQTAAADEEQPPLHLTVAVSGRGFIVGGAGGVMRAADGSLPTIPCGQPLVEGRCSLYLTTRKNPQGARDSVWVDHYHYDALRTLVEKIKAQYPHERQVILSADHQIPYQMVVRTMDLLRGNATAACTGKDGCYFDQVVLSAGVQ